MRAITFIWLQARIAWERWCISSNEAYLRACAEDGIYGTESLREWNKQLAASRARLAMLESQR